MFIMRRRTVLARKICRKSRIYTREVCFLLFDEVVRRWSPFGCCCDALSSVSINPNEDAGSWRIEGPWSLGTCNYT